MAWPRIGWPAAVLAALALAVAATAIGHHHRMDPDDAWSLSFAWQWRQLGSERDLAFGLDQGLSGVRWFGKLHAALQALWCGAWGWTFPAAHALATLMAVGAAGLWTLALRRWRWGWPRAVAAGALMLLLPAGLSAADSARSEAFLLLLGAAAMLSAGGGAWLLAGLLAGLAVETHPMGLVAVAMLAAALWGRRRQAGPSGAAGACLGLALGLGAWFALHGGALDGLARSIAATVAQAVAADSLSGWYLRGDPLRLVEAFASAAALLLFAWRGGRLAVIAAAALAVVVLCPRVNEHYAALAAPALAIALAAVAGRARGVGALCLAVVLLAAGAQHAWRRWSLRGLDPAAHAAALAALVPDDGLPVLAGPDAWPAFHERGFRCAVYLGRVPDDVQACWWLEDDAARWPAAWTGFRNDALRADLERRFRMTRVAEGPAAGEWVVAWRCVRIRGGGRRDAGGGASASPFAPSVPAIPLPPPSSPLP